MYTLISLNYTKKHETQMVDFYVSVLIIDYLYIYLFIFLFIVSSLKAFSLCLYA